jgi:hypothetical protein
MCKPLLFLKPCHSDIDDAVYAAGFQTVDDISADAGFNGLLNGAGGFVGCKNNDRERLLPVKGINVRKIFFRAANIKNNKVGLPAIARGSLFISGAAIRETE